MPKAAFFQSRLAASKPLPHLQQQSRCQNAKCCKLAQPPTRPKSSRLCDSHNPNPGLLQRGRPSDTRPANKYTEETNSAAFLWPHGTSPPATAGCADYSRVFINISCHFSAPLKKGRVRNNQYHSETLATSTRQRTVLANIVQAAEKRQHDHNQKQLFFLHLTAQQG